MFGRWQDTYFHNRRRWATYRLGTEDKVPSLFDQADSICLDGDSIRLNDEKNDDIHLLAASIAKKGKVPPTEMTSALLRLCTGHYLSVEQLGRLLNRNPVRLRSVFLGPMVREGLLQLRFPEAPNHPNQAYIATNKGST